MGLCVLGRADRNCIAVNIHAGNTDRDHGGVRKGEGQMTRKEKIDIMMEHISEHAGTIPGYLWDDYREAVDMAFRKIERTEREEKEEPVPERA